MSPRLAAPGDREKIERALARDPELLRGLEALTRTLGISRRGWHRVPALQAFSQAAAVLEAGRIVAREGKSPTDALQLAAVRLEISPDTARNRNYRWTARAISSPVGNDSPASERELPRVAAMDSSRLEERP